MPERFVTQQQLAEALGLSVRQLRNLPQMPRTRRGYPLVKCREWYAAKRRADDARRTGGQAPRTPLDRARLRKAQALAAQSIRRARRLEENALAVDLAAQIIAEVRHLTAASFTATAKGLIAGLVGLNSIPQAFETLRAGVNELLRVARDEVSAEFTAATPAAPPPPTLETFATLAAARAERWTADARRIELETTLADGTAVLVDAHVRELNERLARLRATLFGCLPRYAVQATRLDARGAAAVWRRIIADALAQYDSVGTP